MFEQASIDSSGLLKRPWAITVSFAGQAAALSAVAVVSLIQTDSLPRTNYFSIPTPPRYSFADTRSTTKATATQPVKTRSRLFVAPMSIPRAVGSAGPDAPRLSPDEFANGPGIMSNIDGVPGQFSGLLVDVMPAGPVRQPEERAIPDVPTRPIPVSTGVQAAKLITQVNPIYPALARQARVTGKVRLTAIIGRDGAIRNLQIMSGHPLLTPAAIEAVKQWRYQPTLLNDEPVEVITQIDVNFTLSR